MFIHLYLIIIFHALFRVLKVIIRIFETFHCFQIIHFMVLLEKYCFKGVGIIDESCVNCWSYDGTC